MDRTELARRSAGQRARVTVEFVNPQYAEKPPEKTGPGRRFVYPFDRIAVGGCFIVRGRSYRGISPYVAYATKALNRKFTCRTHGRDVVTVWRIK